jgi:hypothetical protein
MSALSPQMLGTRPAVSRRDPASLRPQPQRDGADFWPTPVCLTSALTVNVLPALSPCPLWEFAAGDGRVAQAMRAAGHTVLASDIKPRGEGIERRDFLHDPPPQGGTIATSNPPYRELDKFLARGLQLLDLRLIAGFVLLVRTDALTAASRADAFNRASALWMCCWRPVWVAGTTGNGRWSNAWVLWLPDHPGPPATHWILREQKQGALLGLRGLP